VTSVIQAANGMKFVTETSNEIKSSFRDTTGMMCNANRDWKWNLWCKWKLKWK